MSEQTKEGERMNCILSIWMSEQTAEGERMNCILSIWMSEQTNEGEQERRGLYSPQPSPGVCGRNKTTMSNGGILSLKVPDQGEADLSIVGAPCHTTIAIVLAQVVVGKGKIVPS